MAMTGFGRRAVLGGAAALASAGRARTQGAAPVRIGVLTDEGGPYASSGGAGSAAAARMAVQEFGGTVLGLPVEVLRADTQNKPDVAASLARNWYDSGVDAITDLPVTPVAAAVQQVAKDKQRTVMITAAAVTEFTSKLCAPVSSHWADDTHAMAEGAGRVLTGAGKSWYFIAVDFSFGAALQAEAARVVQAAGGRVLGGIKFPLGSTDYSAQIVQAASSGADVIGLAAVGGDQVNLIKQAAEFGLTAGGKQTLAGFLVYITDIQALGLPVAQGFRFPSSFYWDTDEGTRAFARRFMAERKAMPTSNQAYVYAATLHYLRAMAQAGTRDAVAVNRAMRAMPVRAFGKDVAMRGDGRVMQDLVLYRVKAPAESRDAWDLLAPLGTVPAADAFLAASPACTA